MELEVDSWHYVTVNTHQVFTRTKGFLLYSLSPSPVFIRKTMNTILPGVLCYIEDTLVPADSDWGQLKVLNTLLERLKFNILHLQSSVKYLGHVINKSGLCKTSNKVEAVLKALKPRNQQELKFSLGSIHYYSKFI